jgi:tRNAHis guanylyltransferase
MTTKFDNKTGRNAAAYRTLERSFDSHIGEDAEYVMIRLSLHSFVDYKTSKDMPECEDFLWNMSKCAKKVVDHVQGAIGAYVIQDDIIVIVRPDVNGEYAYGERFSSFISHAVSAATLYMAREYPDHSPVFNALVVTFDDQDEALEYLKFRQSLGRSQAVKQVARINFPDIQVKPLNTKVCLEMLKENNVNFNADYNVKYRQGTVIRSSARTLVIHTAPLFFIGSHSIDGTFPLPAE